jgi:hypothetical protein
MTAQLPQSTPSSGPNSFQPAAVQINPARHEWRSALFAEFFADGRGGITHLVDRPQQLFFANSEMPT